MKKEFDVVVVGGGLAGVACALELAARRKEVLLVERRPTLGWESTWAGQLDYSGKRSPLASKILQEVERVGGMNGNVVDGPILELALDRMVQAAGISVLLYSFPVRLVFKGETALGVVVASRSGERVMRGRAIVDATEEALLWRQTGVMTEELGAVAARHSFFMNHAGDGLTLPLDLGKGFLIGSSVWSGEVRVEYAVTGGDPTAVRRALPDAIRRARKVPQLRDALVSHVANESFPLSASIKFKQRGIIHPRLRNLYGCGIWASDAENTATGRLALGERVAAKVQSREGPRGSDRTLSAGSVFSPPEIVTDVLVVGGGTAGAIAAIAAARSGLHSTIIEATNSLGGIGTAGAIHNYYHGVAGGIQDEVDARTAQISPLFCGKWDVSGFHPEAKKQALHEMAREAGADVRFDTIVTGVRLKSGEVRRPAEPGKDIVLREGDRREKLLGVLAASASGAAMYRAKVFIDCTGDGDVAALSGAPFILGREKDNICHTYTQAAGRLDAKSGGLRHLNFDAGYVDPTDVDDMTRARRYGIQLYWQEAFTEDTRLLYIAPMLGVRQGRQIIGEYQLTLADEIAGRRFDDAVSFMQAHYDNHGYDYENESNEAILWVWVLGNWSKAIGCEVPYRCLLPRNVDGLLIASRAISLTYDAHHAFRMQRDIQRIGEVAALVADQAIRDGVEVRLIDVKKLQVVLRERGLLDERCRPKPAIPELQLRGLAGDTSAGLSQAEGSAWLAVRNGQAGLPGLKDALGSPDPKVRFKASAALACLGDEQGLSTLLKCLEHRTPDVPEGNRTVPLWEAAVPFLGVPGNRDAVPALIEILRDPEAPLDSLIASVRSLGRIGEAGAAEALRGLLQRADLPAKRALRANPGVSPVLEDARWQLVIATAEAMGRLGAPPDEVRDILRPFLDDERAYVRRFAHRVLREAGIPATQ